MLKMHQHFAMSLQNNFIILQNFATMNSGEELDPFSTGSVYIEVLVYCTKSQVYNGYCDIFLYMASGFLQRKLEQQHITIKFQLEKKLEYYYKILTTSTPQQKTKKKIIS